MIDAGSIVKEMQDMREEGHLSDALLRHAVRSVHKAEPKFDWVGVYMLGEGGDELWLHNYVGVGTEHAKIPVGQGICGTAVAEAANQNVPDVTASGNYLLCDPLVKSEMVVLIRAGDEIFGQFDLDSREAAAFTDDDEAALSSIADKLAEQLAHERR